MMCKAAIDMRFKVVLYHNGCSFNRTVRVSPVVGVQVVIAKGEFSFVRYLGFCNTSNGDIMISTVVFPYLSFGGNIKASNIMGSNSEV